MQSITIRIKELQLVVAKNLDEHIKTYDEAIEGWKKESSEIYTKNAASVLKDEPLLSIAAKPQSHEKDYRKILRMCELSADTEVELQDHEFQMYIMDEWTWKQMFVASTMNYSK